MKPNDQNKSYEYDRPASQFLVRHYRYGRVAVPDEIRQCGPTGEGEKLRGL